MRNKGRLQRLILVLATLLVLALLPLAAAG